MRLSLSEMSTDVVQDPVKSTYEEVIHTLDRVDITINSLTLL
jgi:hypothetical protein